MSGEQWGEAVDAATKAIDVACDSANVDGAWRLEPDAEYYDMPGVFAQEAATFARAAIEAAAPLIVADTRRKVAEEIALAIEADAAELRLSTRPNNNPAEIAYAVGVEAGAVIARTHAIARGSGNGDSGQEGT